MLRARFTHASKTLHAKTPKHLHGSDIHARLAVSGRNDGYVDVVRGRRMERVEAFLTAQHAGNKILGNRRAHVLVDLPGAAPGWGEYAVRMPGGDVGLPLVRCCSLFIDALPIR